MSIITKIQWTNHTWNPWRGCDKIHCRCKNCYMFTEQTRYGQDPSVVTRTKTWNDPIKWQRAAQKEGVTQLVFTCSWSDWFHKDADQWRDEAWAVVKQCPNLIFQILTKRPERIAAHLPADWGDGYPNVWLGSSLDPIDKHGMELFDIKAKVRFLSLEPLLGDVDLMLVEDGADSPAEKSFAKPTKTGQMLDWVIVGGESGPGARPCNVEWIRSIVRQCKSAGVPVFVKQMGQRPCCSHSSLSCTCIECFPFPIFDKKGGAYMEMPHDIRVRQFPCPK